MFLTYCNEYEWTMFEHGTLCFTTSVVFFLFSLNVTLAQSLHNALPLPCQRQGSHRAQWWFGLDKMAVCQRGDPIPQSAVARTAPLSSVS